MAFTAPQSPLPTHQQQHAPPSRGRGGSPIPSARVPHSASFSSTSTLDAASSEEIPAPDFRRSLLPHLPQAVSHFFGHRPPHRTRFAPPTAFTTAWHTLGAFLSILAVAGTMIQLYGFDDATVVGSIVLGGGGGGRGGPAPAPRPRPPPGAPGPPPRPPPPPPPQTPPSVAHAPLTRRSRAPPQPSSS